MFEKNLLADMDAERQQRTKVLTALAIGEIGSESLSKHLIALLRDLPYRSMAVTVVEAELPGGHSPAYAAMVNTPAPTTQFTWRNDPAAFLNFPEFFLAHELAHQWWGQAVGWKNYHEQWLSEGFAQYFAALYAARFRGNEVFEFLEEGLKARFPGVKFVSWREFGNTHGSDEREVVAALPKKFKEMGVDAVISGMGSFP